MVCESQTGVNLPAGVIRFGAIQRHKDTLEKLGAPTDLSTVVFVQVPPPLP